MGTVMREYIEARFVNCFVFLFFFLYSVSQSQSHIATKLKALLKTFCRTLVVHSSKFNLRSYSHYAMSNFNLMTEDYTMASYASSGSIFLFVNGV